MSKKYKSTLFSCYIGYIVQAIVNNLLPLFFVVFQEESGISNTKLGNLILFNFLIQICVDLFCAKFGRFIGYRKSMVFAHFSAALGLCFISVLPMLLGNLYISLCIATFFFAIGGGLIEVMVSPMMDSMITDNKGAAMALLHSFYSWGQVLVVAVTTVLVKIFGIGNWQIVPIFWALIPFCNMFAFFKAPVPKMLSEKKRISLKHLFKNRIFIIMIIMMVCAGGFELAISQWSSYFAETGLKVSKTMGDLLGPCLFAVFMGASRVLYGFVGEKISIDKAIAICSALGIFCYIAAGLCMNPYVALLGCAICGFAVGIMWPGVYSIAGSMFKGGTVMFGVLAVAGDIGCSLGPWLTGFISPIIIKSEYIVNLGASFGFTAEQIGIKLGVLSGIIFPIIAFIFAISGKLKNKEKS